MHKFVLPLVIDRRRAILFDVIDENEDPKGLSNYLDTFIIDFPLRSSELVGINSQQVLQSLIQEEEDAPLTNLAFHLSEVEEDDSRLFWLNMSHTPFIGSNGAAATVVVPGLEIMLKQVEKGWAVELKRKAEYRGAQDESFKLVICYKSPKGIRYLNHLNVHLANRDSILTAGLDFGSEASQLRYAQGKQEARPFDLLEAIRAQHYPEKSEPRDRFVQHEESNQYLYRSVFFAKKQLTGDSEDLDLLTLRRLGENGEDNFDNLYHKIPNLKLLGLEEDLGAEFIFTGPQKRETSLLEIKDRIYNGLVEKMISAFLRHNHESKLRWLRFTILVPNIYDVNRVSATKTLVAQVIDGINREKLKNVIKAFEINVLSESDASFLGYASMGETNIHPDKFTIVIDCGKGTTDFSITITNPDASIKSVYRNGFAGAGNLISYAFFETMVGFFSRLCDQYKDKDAEKYARIKRFIHNSILSETSNFRYRLYVHVERWKKTYLTGISLTREEIESHWRKARTGTISFESVFDQPSDLQITSELDLLLKEILYIYDWDNHIVNATRFIADTTKRRLEWVVRKMSRKYECAGILLTGRGFLFKPLASEIKVVLSGSNGITSAEILDTGGIDLKEVCMMGIFNNRYVTHSDVICTPIEVGENDMNRAIQSSDISGGGKWQRLFDWFNLLLGVDGSQLYEEDTNSFKVEQTNLLKAKFRMGEAIFHTEKAGIQISSAKLLISRSGLHIVAADKSGNKSIIDLIHAQGRSNPEMLPVIWKSLFPVFFKPEYISSISRPQ